jgi:hypothetical protein
MSFSRAALLASDETPDAGVEDAAEPDEEADDAGRVHGGRARLQLQQPIRDKLL